jgi:hypothetical protein
MFAFCCVVVLGGKKEETLLLQGMFIKEELLQSIQLAQV